MFRLKGSSHHQGLYMLTYACILQAWWRINLWRRNM